MIQSIELECLEFIESDKPFVLATYYEIGAGEITEQTFDAKKMYKDLVAMNLINLQCEIEGVQTSEPLPFSAMEMYINEMDFQMQEQLLADYLLYKDIQKRLN